ncbi:protein FAM43B-like [Megalops cyprinoides]|uniref:protein FAM43B-like n=1 Tax=Megalops cyprinoides TaxID=118141 RepID=UPI001863B28C|nr:protein FAM43B-like [Megalops cyprinoides]
MLPWRRSKFVLTEEETRSKPKSLSVGATYWSIITSLVRSCPDLLPERPFRQLAGAFRTRRRKVELNKEEPVYTVHYLGSTVTLTAKGEGCAEEAVGKIWSRSDYGGHGTRMKLSVGPQGLRLGPGGDRGSKRPCHIFLLHRITYCAPDARRPKILAWVYRHQAKNKAVVLRCHAALVSGSEKARAAALTLNQASASAFGEFKRLQRQSDVRRARRQLLGEDVIPPAPLRRLLNGQCPYRPPADAPHSASQLGPIAEEEEEEEEEKEEEESGGTSLSAGDAQEAVEGLSSFNTRDNSSHSEGPSVAG